MQTQPSNKTDKPSKGLRIAVRIIAIFTLLFIGLNCLIVYGLLSMQFLPEHIANEKTADGMSGLLTGEIAETYAPCVKLVHQFPFVPTAQGQQLLMEKLSKEVGVTNVFVVENLSKIRSYRPFQFDSSEFLKKVSQRKASFLQSNLANFRFKRKLPFDSTQPALYLTGELQKGLASFSIQKNLFFVSGAAFHQDGRPFMMTDAKAEAPPLVPPAQQGGEKEPNRKVQNQGSVGQTIQQGGEKEPNRKVQNQGSVGQTIQQGGEKEPNRKVQNHGSVGQTIQQGGEKEPNRKVQIQGSVEQTIQQGGEKEPNRKVQSHGSVGQTIQQGGEKEPNSKVQNHESVGQTIQQGGEKEPNRKVGKELSSDTLTQVGEEKLKKIVPSYVLLVQFDTEWVRQRIAKVMDSLYQYHPMVATYNYDEQLRGFGVTLSHQGSDTLWWAGKKQQASANQWYERTSSYYSNHPWVRPTAISSTPLKVKARMLEDEKFSIPFAVVIHVLILVCVVVLAVVAGRK